VTQAGAVSILPLTGLLARVPFTVDGRPVERERVPLAQFRIVSPGYFEAAGIPISRGRSFDEGDSEGRRPVALVNEELARQWLAGVNPLSVRLLIDDNDSGPRPVEIVGVVANVQQLALEGAPTWDVYLPYAQVHHDGVGLAAASMFWTVRTSGEPAALSNGFSREVRRIDPGIAASQVQPMAQYFSEALAPRRFSVSLVGIFAAAALTLAIVGIYAVIAYGVSQRGRELAIRLALGATEGAIVRLVVRDGMRFVGVGMAIGVAGAAVAARLASTLLFGVSADDVASFTDVVIVVAGLSFLACAAPAARSSRFLRLLTRS
jgi:ABC-type antimicrobial peptide transport system permease subunit